MFEIYGTYSEKMKKSIKEYTLNDLMNIGILLSKLVYHGRRRQIIIHTNFKFEKKHIMETQ